MKEKRIMLSPQARRFNFILKNFIKPPQAVMPMTPAVMRGLRNIVDAGNKWVSRVPPHVSIVPVRTGGVPAEWVACGDGIAPYKVVYYLHGGGYFFCSPATHRGLTWRLSRETKLRVLSLDYRMVPEHTLDDCCTDAVKGYRWLLDQGYAPWNIVIGGDSAGGGLTLLTLLALRDKGIPLPKAAFCLSPFTDMTATSPTFISNLPKSHLFHKNALKQVEAYLSAGKDPRDPSISPAFGDYKGLPPLLIQTADTELLLNDSLLVVENAKKAGVDVDFKLWHNLPHVFSVFADFIPEGKAGIKEIAGFVNRHLFPA
jgi:acetyl esterase/lipase